MKLGRWIVLLLTAAGIGVIYWYATRPPLSTPPAVAAVEGSVVRVLAAPLRRESIEERLVTYGTVVAALGKSQTLSEPFEVRVRRVFVTAGESVDVGVKLVEIEPSPDTQLKLDQARSEARAAQELERLTKESFNMKLSTRQELNAVEQRLQDAQVALQSMLDRGMAGPRLIQAEHPGVVMQISVQAGQIVAAGSPLLEIAGENQIDVRLGIEDEDVGNLQVGQAVRIVPVHQAEGRTVDARIALITQQVNPQSRLIDIYVAPESTARLMLNEYVRGEIVIAAEQALVAPRSAVLPDEDHYVVFTVEQDRAIKHAVKVGMENDRQMQILGTDLQPGQLVVVSGNSELRDGMAVKMEPVP